MVRETKFAFDDESQDSSPFFFEDFTDEDDRFLDAFSPPEDRSQTGQAGSSPAESTNPVKDSKASKKHLADADWINPASSKGPQGRKSA